MDDFNDDMSIGDIAPESLADVSWDTIDQETPSEVTTSETETTDSAEAPPSDIEAKEETSETPNESSEEKPKVEPEAKPEAGPSNIKKIVAKFGTDNLEIPADALIPHKIDGQEVEIPLQKLLNNYAGEVAYDKKFSALDLDRKQWKAEVDEVNSYVNTFREKFQGENGAVEAFTYLGELSGMPAYIVREQLLAGLAPLIEQRSQMTASQLQLQLAHEQSQFLKEKTESEAKQKQAQQASLELQQANAKLRETHGISETEWSEAESFLRNHPEVKDVSAELVANFAVYNRAEARAESLLSSLELPLENTNVLVSSLRDIAVENPDFTDEDLKKIAEEVVGSQRKNQASEKLVEKASRTNNLKSSKPKAPVVTGPSDYELDWDDL